MLAATIRTPRLELILESLEETRTRIDAMPDEHKEALSADWLARLDAATTADPWLLGYNLTRIEDRVVVGQCGFKGPPSPDGAVEIAYGVDPRWQGKGYATEAARVLTRHALQEDDVGVVRAHTLPEPNASTRVLTRCGFRHIGEVIDPEDGRVWRWEMTGERGVSTPAVSETGSPPA